MADSGEGDLTFSTDDAMADGLVHTKPPATSRITTGIAIIAAFVGHVVTAGWPLPGLTAMVPIPKGYQ